MCAATGCIECTLFRYIGNSALWRSASFPSSNGFVSARSVARILGAIANGGDLLDIDEQTGNLHTRHLMDEAETIRLFKCLTDKTCQLPPEHGQKSPSRLSCGFSPWFDRRIQGKNAARCFGHNGMNGCATYADPDARLSIAVMKTVYGALQCCSKCLLSVIAHGILRSTDNL